MKSSKLMRFASLFLLVGILASCGGLKNIAKKIDLVKFEVNPNPLEMHNGKVKVNITATFPEKYFDPKVVVEITPYIAYGDQVENLKPVTLQGEKAQNNFDVIKKTGGTASYTDEFDFVDEMRVCELKLKIKAWKDGSPEKAVDVPYDKVLATGIITTSELTKMAMEEDVLEASSDMFKGTVSAEVQLPEKTIVPYSAKIYYERQRSNIRRSESKKEEVSKFVQSVNQAKGSDLKYVGTEISSYASPEGPLDLNEKLVENRGKSAKQFMGKNLKDAEIAAAEIKQTTKSEDWDGFRAELEKSNIDDKEIILRVLSMHSDPVVREQEIKNIAEAYEELKEKILPILRRSEIRINFESKQRSNDEILALAKNEPAQLTEVELLHGGTVSDDLETRKAVYENFIATYPNDWRGPNNLGVIYMGLGNEAAAKAEFNKADHLSSGNGIVQNNLGVIAAREGKFAKAASYLKNASVSDPNVQKLVDYNLGSVASASGNYDEANSKLSGSNTISEAITKLNKGDLTGARRAIDGAKSEAGLKYYIKAVIEARDKKTDAAISNLKTAFQKDASLRARAKTDMEFHELRETEPFKALL